ncbi:MAG: hypothetical protein AB1641_07910 [Thermodesulfobacteriota bacterium]
MEAERKKIRLTSCVEAIVALHESLVRTNIDTELIAKFKQLEKTLRTIQLDEVSDLDIERVEQATNRLMRELKFFYDARDSNIHSGALH